MSFNRHFVIGNNRSSSSSSSGNDGAAGPLTLPGPSASSSRLLDTTGLQQLDATASFIQPLADDNDSSSTATAATAATTTSSAVLYQLSTGELVGVIVAASLVTAALIGVVIWLQWRNRRKRKGASVTSPPPNGANGQQQQVSIISMESTKSSVSRQNSVANGIGLGYNNNAMTSFTRNGPDDGPAGAAGATMDDEVFTEYGSIVGSFPPSPTLSFRSAIDAPGFNRSRAGTGTSFGTVASFSSYRSRLSNTASFHTCVQEDFI